MRRASTLWGRKKKARRLVLSPSEIEERGHTNGAVLSTTVKKGTGGRVRVEGGGESAEGKDQQMAVQARKYRTVESSRWSRWRRIHLTSSKEGWIRVEQRARRGGGPERNRTDRGKCPRVTHSYQTHALMLSDQKKEREEPELIW